MPSNHKLSTYKTTITAKNGNTTIRYCSTAIVEFDHECIILRSGGWETVTTKRKMNQAANQFDLPYGVHQAKGIWYVTARNPAYSVHGDEPYWLESSKRPFEDGMKLDRNTGLEFKA